MAMYLKVSILIIITVLCVWLILYFKQKEKLSKPIADEVIKNYITHHFSEYEIVAELAPNNKNKIYSIKKNSQDYILKITCKNIKRAYKEASLLQELGPSIPTPTLISACTKSIPGHILMSHCGSKLAKSDQLQDYYNFGKVIARIFAVRISDQNKKLLTKNRTKYIKKLSTKIDCSHPYVQYFNDYKHLNSNYFCHGDMHINQAIMQTDGSLSIIDWESAALSYRVFDLSRALSHCLKQKCSVAYPQAILKGYKSIVSLTDEQEIKLLLSLIWYDLNKTHHKWKESGLHQKRVDFIDPLIMSKSLEEIFDLNI